MMKTTATAVRRNDDDSNDKKLDSAEMKKCCVPLRATIKAIQVSEDHNATVYCGGWFIKIIN